MKDDVNKRRKPSKGLRRFLAVTMGPRAFVSQSFGTDVGSTLKDQYTEWKKVNDVNIKEVIAKRKGFDFEKKCFENRRRPDDVRKAYRNVAVIQGFLWFGISLTAAIALAGSGSVIAGLFNILALIALPAMLLAATHHQICIKEKRFLSPGELLKFISRRPGTLIPSSLPPEWRLYTKDPQAESKAEMTPKRKVTIKKRG
ncbi:hypothetical protein [Marinobacter sp.]|uniref:hypothetical protein n=1 Tax=Marinobacter sp. TaxID=50741 RepID=UPI003564C2FA